METKTRVFESLAGEPRGADMGPEIDETAAIRELQENGFKPGYISDLVEGDIWVKEPERFPYRDYATMVHVVERILPVQQTYYLDEPEYEGEERGLVTNVVVNLICVSEDGLERHMSYGSTHGVYIYRGEV